MEQMHLWKKYEIAIVENLDSYKLFIKYRHKSL